MGILDRLRSKKKKKRDTSGADYFVESGKDGNLF